MGSKRQNSQLELAFGEAVRGEAPNGLARGTEDPMARPAVEGSAAPPGFVGGLMEVIVARDNLKEALRQVKRNKGAPGVDGMTVEALAPYLKEHWPAIRARLLDGTYRPLPVRRVEIAKPGGGKRALGIPTVLDRFVQQAVLQVLQGSMGRNVQREQLRVSAGPLGASGGGAGARIHCVGPALGGGPRPGEVL
jgi:RNA-directed DNA polymerase